MDIPEHIQIRREYNLEPLELKELTDWTEMKKLAQHRMRDATRRFNEADTIVAGIITKKKYDLGWANGDNVLFDADRGQLLDLIPGVDGEGRCLNCGEKHGEDDDDH